MAEADHPLKRRAPIFLRRVRLQNYKSIGGCSLELRALNFLVGPNGAGKSNFLDALHFTSDALGNTVEHALRDRGGIAEVRRRSLGHPRNFKVELDWLLPSGDYGTYAYSIGAKSQGGFEVQSEKCTVHFADLAQKPAGFEVRAGVIESISLPLSPARLPDRLFLHEVSGQPEFRPLYEALVGMGFYNFSPDIIRKPQSPDPGQVLALNGENLASVLKRLDDANHAARKARLVELLGLVVPGITGVSPRSLARWETLEFRQSMVGSEDSWRFDAGNMSDGTLRALGVLVALFQPPSSEGRSVPLVGIEEPESALHPGAAAVLRSALFEASTHTQVIVTSHSPDLLDDKAITADSLITVVNRGGETFLGPVDAANREALRDRLFTAGELLRLNQLEPDLCLHDRPSQPTLDLPESP